MLELVIWQTIRWPCANLPLTTGHSCIVFNYGQGKLDALKLKNLSTLTTTQSNRCSSCTFDGPGNRYFHSSGPKKSYSLFFLQGQRRMRRLRRIALLFVRSEIEHASCLWGLTLLESFSCARGGGRVDSSVINGNMWWRTIIDSSVAKCSWFCGQGVDFCLNRDDNTTRLTDFHLEVSGFGT
jgi:hypothetical protein